MKALKIIQFFCDMIMVFLCLWYAVMLIVYCVMKWEIGQALIGNALAILLFFAARFYMRAWEDPLNGGKDK